MTAAFLWPRSVGEKTVMKRMSDERLLICPTCGGSAYVVVERDDGTRAVERCDTCAANCLTDERAAILARHDGIDCAETPPYLIKEPN